MPVTTRYQRVSELYESVLEQPLLLENILKNLTPKDIVCLHIAGCKSERFVNTIDYFLQQQYEYYLAQKDNARNHEFVATVIVLLKKAEKAHGIPLRIRQVNDVYDFFCANMWFKEVSLLRKFVPVVQQKLIKFLVEYPDDYAHYALHYLDVLFGIKLMGHIDEETGEFVEYILDTNGNTITW